MRYEFLHEDDGVKIYARIEDDGKCYVTCSEDNPEYQTWLAEGNIPQDYVPAQPDETV